MGMIPLRVKRTEFDHVGRQNELKSICEKKPRQWSVGKIQSKSLIEFRNN